MAGYTRQSSAQIVSGEVISAAPINAELNQVLAAFNNSTGHSHDGTSAEGPPIDRVADADQRNMVLVDTSNNHIEFYNEVGGAATQQVRIQDGAIVPITTNDIDLGTASLEFKDMFIDGTAHIDTLDVDVNATVAGTLGVTGALTGTNITASTAFLPDASDGASLGTTSLEFSDLYLADGAVIALGEDQDVTLTHVADTGILLNSTNKIQFNDASQFIHGSSNAVLSLGATDEIDLTATAIDINGTADISGNTAIGGNATITGTTTTTGVVTANNNVVVSSTNQLQFGDSGTYIHQSADGVLDLVSDTEIEINATTVDVNGAVEISGNTSVGGTLTSTGKITADAGIDIDNFNIDGTTIALSSGDMTLDGAADIILDAGGDEVIFKDGSTNVGHVSMDSDNLTIKSLVSDKDIIFQGNDGGSGITALTLDMSGAGAATFNSSVTATALSVGDGNITNVGDIALDSISADDTDINVAVTDNSATAFTIKQGSDAYLVVDTANSSESVSIGTGISGTAVTIGHGTSEVTIGDNLTVSGNLTVQGTQTVVDTVTMNAENAVVFEGATADEHETTLTIIDPTADRTINLPNQSGTIPVLAAVSTTQITSTPEELNLLDGITAGTVSASLAVIADSNKDISGFRNVTLTGELDAGSLDVSGNADIDGTLEADAITVDGTALNEYISDTVGAMVTSNTETGITVTYDDSDNTLDFVVGTLNQDTTGTAAIATSVTVSANNSANETVYPLFVDGATGTQGAETDTGLSYNPSTGLLSTAGVTASGTVSFGSLTDGSVTITDIADEDDFSSNSATKLATQQSIKAYVEANRDVQGVQATGAEINTSSDGDTTVGTTAVAGGDGIVTNDAGTMRQTSVDTFDTYFAGTTKTLTNKTLTAPKIVDGGFIADANGNEGIVLQTASSAVNALEVTNAATGGSVVVGAMGDDSNIDIDITPKGTGEVNIAAGNLNYAGTAITSTGAEINKLDGYNGSVTELNYLKDLYDTGVTNTEYDYLDGVTSNIQTQLNARASTGKAIAMAMVFG